MVNQKENGDSPMIETSLNIPAKDGFQLSAVLREPKPKSKGFVQLHCGTGIPQTLYANFAKYLSVNGYTTLTFDYRGIGGSRPKSLKGFEAYIRDWGQKDMVGVLDWVHENYPKQRKIVVAHSMGGQMIGLMENNHRIEELFLIASSTGYWRDMSTPFRWLLPPFWFLYIPSSIALFGYVPAKNIGQGEDLPKGVAQEWKHWCVHPDYFESEFGKTLQPLYFDQLRIPLKSIQISDDPIANTITSNKLLDYFVNAPITIEQVKPSDVGVERIGHAGFFSRRFESTLWAKLLNDINTAFK